MALQNQLPVLGKAKVNKKAILLEGQGKRVKKRENNALSDTDNIDKSNQSNLNYNVLSFLFKRCHINDQYSMMYPSAITFFRSW